VALSHPSPVRLEVKGVKQNNVFW